MKGHALVEGGYIKRGQALSLYNHLVIERAPTHLLTKECASPVTSLQLRPCCTPSSNCRYIRSLLVSTKLLVSSLSLSCSYALLFISDLMLVSVFASAAHFDMVSEPR